MRNYYKDSSRVCISTKNILVGDSRSDLLQFPFKGDYLKLGSDVFGQGFLASVLLTFWAEQFFVVGGAVLCTV